MNIIFDAFRESKSPVILLANGSKDINVFRGSFNGQPYAFGMNSEIAYDLFSPGKRLELVPSDNGKEIASDSVSDTEPMKLSDGTMVRVADDTAISLANESIFSPVTGKPVTIAFVESEEDSTEENNETDSEDTESKDTETESVEPETIDENLTDPSMDSEDESENTETEVVESEDEDISEVEDTDVEEMDETDSEENNDSESEDEEMDSEEIDSEEVPTDSEEIPEEIEVEAASFATTHNLRFTAFDSAASEIAVFDGDTHVGTLFKKNAHESKRDLFTKSTLAVAFNRALEEAGFDYNHESLKPYGISVTKFKVSVPGVTKSLLDKVKAEVASDSIANSETHKAKLNQTIKLAIMGIAKGTTESTLISELASAFEVAGVSNAKTIIASSLHKIAPAFTKQIVELASDLATKSPDYLQGLAEITAKASFVPSESKEQVKVVSTNFHIPTVKEIASDESTPRRKNIFSSIRKR